LSACATDSTKSTAILNDRNSVIAELTDKP
jgi:hypothetical protein